MNIVVFLIRHIARLLLVHGRNSYKRSASLSQFVIHRGLIITTMQVESRGFKIDNNILFILIVNWKDESVIAKNIFKQWRTKVGLWGLGASWISKIRGSRGFSGPKRCSPPSWNEKRMNSPRANFCVCHGRQNVLECYQITNKNIMYFCKLRMRTPLSREGILQIVKRPLPQTMFCRMISNCCGMPTLPPSKLSISNSVRKSVC